MTSSDQVLSRIEGATAVIAINRPTHKNALTPLVASELLSAFHRAEQNPAIRAIVITGSGDAFCSGADLSYFLENLRRDDGCERFIDELLAPLAGLVTRIASSDLPVIAAIDGPCAAGGFEIALSCDIIIATDRATFLDAHSRIGLAPAIGGAAALVRAVGSIRARRILLLSEQLSAAILCEYGLVTEVVDAGDLQSGALALAETLGARSPRSIRLMKQQVQFAQAPSVAEIISRDFDALREEWGSVDLVEGITAFLERRAPVYVRETTRSAH